MICLTAVAAWADGAANQQLQNWHQWRGPEATGAAPLGDPPTKWDEQTNIKWKVEIPGKGNATPIIWGDRIFIMTAIKTDREAEAAEGRCRGCRPSESPADASGCVHRCRCGGSRPRCKAGGGCETSQPTPSRAIRPRQPPAIASGRWTECGPRQAVVVEEDLAPPKPPTNVYQFVVMCLDRKTGKTLWQQTACEVVPHEGTHDTGSFASASPITDGKHVYCYFGSRGLYCYDMDGKLQWQKTDFGKAKIVAGFGEGSSPALVRRHARDQLGP